MKGTQLKYQCVSLVPALFIAVYQEGNEEDRIFLICDTLWKDALMHMGALLNISIITSSLDIVMHGI